MFRVRQGMMGVLTALVVAVATLGMAAVADADTLSFAAAYGPESAAFGPSVVASLPKFDPLLGARTLTKVTLTLDSVTSAGTIAWDNEAVIPTDVTLGIGAEVTAEALTALAAIAVPLQIGSATGIAADNDGAPDFIGTDSFSVTGGTGSDSDSDMSTAPATLALFTGAGDFFDVTLTSVVSTFLSTTGGFGPTVPVPGVTEGTVTVVYEYIPEPTTLSLLAIGGLLLSRRRRTA